ncbi:NUDIX domain-containing protein [Sinorhizobium meliloti]
MKGTTKKGEQPQNAAERELLEESGLACPTAMEPLGSLPIGQDRQLWHFFAWHSSGLPDRWYHAAEDDFGHTFAFFWHPIKSPLSEDWHPIFHEAFQFFASRLPAP